MIGTAIGCTGSVGASPNICHWVVSPARVQFAERLVNATPDDHFIAAPDRTVQHSDRGGVTGTGGCPTIRDGIVSPARIQIAGGIRSAPDDHFTAGPHCRVPKSPRRRISSAGSRPTVGAGIISSPSINK